MKIILNHNNVLLKHESVARIAQAVIAVEVTGD